MSDDHFKLKAPDGFEISFGIRYRIFLIINCNFNPFNFIDFAEVNIKSIPGVERLKKVETYEDGTGFFILQVDPYVDKVELIKGIENQFNEYFFKDEKLHQNY